MIHMYTLPLYEVLDINHILTLSEETHTVSCSVTGGAMTATLVVIFPCFYVVLTVSVFFGLTSKSTITDNVITALVSTSTMRS